MPEKNRFPAVLQPVAIHDVTGRDKAQNGKGWNDDGTRYTLDTAATQGVVLSVHGTQDPDIRNNQAHTLGRNSGQENAVLAFQSSQSGVRIGETHATLDANNGPRRHNGALVGMAVRRLTPTECERLQGFPEVRKSFKISVSFDRDADVCSGHQKSFVSAGAKNLRSQSNALHADESGFQSSAKAAGVSLNAGQANSSEPVLVNVLIDLERQQLQLRSAGRLLLSVSTAEQSDWCRLPINRADFAQLIARMHEFEESSTHPGEEVEQQSMICSTHRQSGSVHAQLSGHEIGELVSDAEKFTSALRECLKYTTSAVGQSFQSFGLNRETLFSCVASVICSCIPEQIQSGSSFSLSIETVAGWTLVPHRGKPAADGPRYKALGNSMAVPVMRWLGERINLILRAGD